MKTLTFDRTDATEAVARETASRSSEQIKAEIKQKFGFVPPFFSPAEQNPQVLESLWQQTLSAYVNNPWSYLFKEKLSAYLSRYCNVPYCMICHSCTLRPLGMKARQVLELLQSPPPRTTEIDEHLNLLALHTDELALLSLNSKLEESLLNCAIFIALEREETEYCRNELRRLLGATNYQHLVAFIAYVKMCHVWMEAHPEVAYEADKRVQDNFTALLEEEPDLANFFRNYGERVRHERQSRAEQLAELAERQRHIAALRKASAKNLRLAQAVASVSDGVLITDPNQPDNPIIYANPAFSRITGYHLEEIIGHNCRFLQGPGTDPQVVAQIRQAIAEQREVKATLLNYRQDGQPFWNELKISPVFSEEGNLLYFVGIQTDITQRQQLEIQLRESKQKFQLIAKATNDAIWDWDLLTDAVWWNEGVQTLFGYGDDEILPDATWWYERIHPDDRQRVISAIHEASDNNGSYWAGTYRFRRADNSYAHVSDRGYLVRDDMGNAIRMIGGMTDITELKQTEAALRTIIDTEPECVKVVAADGTLLDMNAAGLAMIEVESAEVAIGQSVYSLVAPECRKAYQALNESVCNGNRGTLEFEIIGCQGTRRWMETHAVPLRNELNGTVVQLAITRDITERKRAEAQIREQATLLDKSQDAIFVLDLEERIRFWNESAKRLFGWTAGEAIAHRADELLFAEKPPQLAAVQKAVTNSGEWHGELHLVTKDNKEIIVESRWTLVRDQEEKPKTILVVNTNITEKKQLEAQFLRAQRMESIGTLAGGIAHDLNNILTPMLAAAQLLQLKLPHTDERSQSMFRILETNSKRGAALVKQVLSFARGVEGQRTTLQVRHIISEIKQIAKQTFPKSIEFCMDVSPDLWAVSGDATQLHQVLMNLCVNARDAMPNGGTLSVSAANLFVDRNYARMHLEAEVGPYVVVTVEDSGTGIPQEIIDRIFEPFFTTKELGKGTGLGLATVIGIIKSHDGFINVSSKVGKGTQFKVFLPAVEATEKLPVAETELPRGNGELILVVDDEAPIREITQISLEDYNYRAITASDGIEAIALYAQHQAEISVVLVDMMMPSMDGATTIRTLQKINPEVKIVAVSGLVASDKLAHQAGAKTFLSKPYTARELMQALSTVLGKQ